MENKELKKLANDFLLIGNIEDYQSGIDLCNSYTPSKLRLSTVLKDFTQSLIDSGFLVTKDVFDRTVIELNSKLQASSSNTISELESEYHCQGCNEVMSLSKSMDIDGIWFCGECQPL